MRRKEDWHPEYATLECLNGLTCEQKEQVIAEAKKRHPYLDKNIPDNNTIVHCMISIAKELGFYN